MTKPTKESPADSSKTSQTKAPATEAAPKADTTTSSAPDPDANSKRPREHGGAKGLEPTRYGDWERNGRCTDF